MELQKESLWHLASQCGCPKKPRLVENHRYCETVWPKEVTKGRGPGSHLHRDLNWEKSSQWCVCGSPRKCMCQPSCTRLNGRATLARVHHRPCSPCVL